MRRKDKVNTLSTFHFFTYFTLNTSNFRFKALHFRNEQRSDLRKPIPLLNSEIEQHMIAPNRAINQYNYKTKIDRYRGIGNQYVQMIRY